MRKAELVARFCRRSGSPRQVLRDRLLPILQQEEENAKVKVERKAS